MFVASDEAAKAQKPSEEALDVPAAPVPPKCSTVLRLGPTGRLVRRDQLDAALSELCIQPVAVIRAIADQLLGQLVHEPRFERVDDELRFMPLTTCSPHGDWKAMAVCHCHDLGRFAAASNSNLKTPLFAPA
jgi:hypothetical protein